MIVHFEPDFYIRMLDVGQGDGINICADDGLLEIIHEGSIEVDYLLLSDVGMESDSYRKVENEAKKAGISVKYVYTGIGVSCNNAVLTVLYPQKGIVCSDENDYSMVTRLSYGILTTN